MTGIPNPAPRRTVTWHGIEILAHDACLACAGMKVVKRGSLGIYPITTNVGCCDRAALAVEACEHCGATGIDPSAPEGDPLPDRPKYEG